jgi:hypothetical protein
LDEEVYDSKEWMIAPVNDKERLIADIVDPAEVNANEPAYAFGVDNCGGCQTDLSRQGLVVDGKMKGQIMWGYFCIPCFLELCEGIGWGKGQLYAKQPSGSWRLVAGFEPSDL